MFVWAALLFFLGLSIWFYRRFKHLHASTVTADVVLESLGEGVYGIDEKGRITFANPKALEIFGFNRNEVIGKDQHLLIHHHYPDSRPYPHDKCPIAQALRDGVVRGGEDIFFRKDGSSFPVQYSVTPVFTNKRVSGAVVAFSDISKRKHAESALETLNERLVALLEAIPDAIFFKDGEGRWLITNETAKKLFELHNIDWQGKTEMELADLHPEFRAAHEACLLDDERAWEAGILTLFAEQVVDENGKVHEFEVRKVPVFGVENQRKGLVIIGRDITEQKEAEEALRIAATAFESEEGMIVTDAELNILQVNQAFTAITGYTPEDAIGQTPRLLRSGRHGKDFYAEMWDLLAQRGYWRGEIWNRRKNGQIYPEWVSITAVRNKGEVTHFVAAFSDISERKEAEAQILNLAYYDPLTGLANRRLLMDRMQHALSATHRSRHWGALLLFDLDHFKTLNDTRGHAFGDALLVQVARRIRNILREEDSFARLGGDEFVVLLENLDRDDDTAATQAESVAENIRAALEAPFSLNDAARQEYLTSASIGISLFRDHEVSVEDVLKQADLALYQAKDSGRNAIRFFNPRMQAAVDDRVKSEAALRHALSHDELELYYQPQVNTAQEIIGVEALIRWLHPEQGLVSPAEFIPLAEQSSLILTIGELTLKQACKQLHAWAANPATSHLQLAVNVSAHQILHHDFVEMVSDYLNEYGVDGKRLKLELTESVFLDNVTDTSEKMLQLKKLGVSFALDDFGTGYSSLLYLKKLPFDQVKIDQSFVRDVVTDGNDAAIVRAIIVMGNALNLQVMAEGVETDEQYNFLLENGCPAFQGFRFSKPITAAELDMLVEDRPSSATGS